MPRTRILLADDHPQICELLRILLEPEFQVVGSVADGEALLKVAHSLQPDVIISDIDMPKVTGLEALPLLKHVAPDTHVIFLTGHDEHTYLEAAFAAGAAGYLVKGTTNDLQGSLRTTIQSIQNPLARPGLTSLRSQHRRPSAGGQFGR
ncbi:MAG TPA: response regulator transcription factor [Nitrospira sp.]|nr:response regulator transcription factor [Nitrospira sp.]